MVSANTCRCSYGYSIDTRSCFCDKGLVLEYDGQCRPVCQYNETYAFLRSDCACPWGRFRNGPNLCSMCSTTCLTCAGPAKSDCLSCLGGYRVILGECQCDPYSMLADGFCNVTSNYETGRSIGAATISVSILSAIFNGAGLPDFSFPFIAFIGSISQFPWDDPAAFSFNNGLGAFFLHSNVFNFSMLPYAYVNNSVDYEPRTAPPPPPAYTGRMLGAAPVEGTRSGDAGIVRLASIPILVMLGLVPFLLLVSIMGKFDYDYHSAKPINLFQHWTGIAAEVLCRILGPIFLWTRLVLIYMSVTCLMRWGLKLTLDEEVAATNLTVSGLCLAVVLFFSALTLTANRKDPLRTIENVLRLMTECTIPVIIELLSSNKVARTACAYIYFLDLLVLLRTYSWPGRVLVVVALVIKVLIVVGIFLPSVSMEVVFIDIYILLTILSLFLMFMPTIEVELTFTTDSNIDSINSSSLPE